MVYLAAAAAAAFGMRAGHDSARTAGVALATIAAVLHGAAFWLEFSELAGPSADFFSTLSLVSLLIVAVLLVGLGRYPLLEILPLALPGAALTVVLRALVSPEPLALNTDSAMLDAHIVTSLLSYSLLSIAALNALVIALLHKLLHRHTGVAIIEALPPLVVMENVLFRLIGVGWIILSISLATGLAFVDDMFAQHLAHKTILSTISWLVFGLLLAGRWRYGWRGMRVVRMCLVGMVILLLAYFGSKAVLELILEQRWQAG